MSEIANESNLKQLQQELRKNEYNGRFFQFDEKRLDDKKYYDEYFKVFDEFVKYVIKQGYANKYGVSRGVADALFMVRPGYPHWENIEDRAPHYEPTREAVFRVISLLPADSIEAEKVLRYAMEWLDAEDFKEFADKFYLKFKNPDIYWQVLGEYLYYKDFDNSPSKFTYDKVAAIFDFSEEHNKLFRYFSNGKEIRNDFAFQRELNEFLEHIKKPEDKFNRADTKVCHLAKIVSINQAAVLQRKKAAGIEN